MTHHGRNRNVGVSLFALAATTAIVVGSTFWPARALAATIAAVDSVSYTLPDDHRPWTEKAAPDLVALAGTSTSDLDVLVKFREPDEVHALSVAAQAAPVRLLWIADTTDGIERGWSAGGVRVLDRYSHVASVHVAVPVQALAALAADSRVDVIVLNRKVHKLDATGNAYIHVNGIQPPNTGTGAGIAIMDTGVDWTHPELAPLGTKTIAFFDAFNTAGTPAYAMDDDGHGTEVAGIAGATGVNPSAIGTAPGATIVSVKILDSTGSGTENNIIQGINAVLSSVGAGNPYHIRAANFSLGGYFTDLGGGSAAVPQQPCDSQDSVMASAFQQLTDANVIPVVAAGNGGCTVGVSWPACISTSLAVGSVYEQAFPYPASFSGTLQCGASGTTGCTDNLTNPGTVACYDDSGAKLDVWAPTCPLGEPLKGGGYDSNYFCGTSASAPYVSGLVALLAQASPSTSATNARLAIRSTGQAITDSRNGVIRNRVDAAQALGVLSGSCAAPAAPSGLAANLTEVCANQAISYTWNAVGAADTYELQTDLDPAFPNPQQVSVHATNVTVSRSSTSQSPLYARVRARASCGTASNFSPTLQVQYRGLCGGPDYTFVYYLSGAAHLPGVAPSFWYTDLAVLNAGSSSADVRLTFFGASFPAPLKANIPARQQAMWTDVLTSLSGFALPSNDVGVIVVESSGPVTVLSRNYSRPPTDSTKTFGQSYDGQDPSRALIPSRTGYFANLRSDGQFRTNVEFVNVSTVEAGITVQFFASGGASLGDPFVLSVGPNRRAAKTAALPAGVRSAFAQVNVSNPGAQVIGYATVIDGNSTDPTTVPLAIP